MASTYDTARDAARRYGDDAQSEIAALRAKVEHLMSERVTPALSDAASRAEAAANAGYAQVRDGAERVGERVREQPLAALGIAALAGFVLASLIRR
jgi:ElaB/YqjD/DUF883 family membrane-anchored ribosome-binding protein